MVFKAKDLLPPGMKKHLISKSQTLGIPGLCKFYSIKHTLVVSALHRVVSSMRLTPHCMMQTSTTSGQCERNHMGNSQPMKT
jgi:hypothetical protein